MAKSYENPMDPYDDRRRTRITSVGLTDKDRELLDWLVEFYGSSKSEILRAALRAYAADAMKFDKRNR